MKINPESGVRLDSRPELIKLLNRLEDGAEISGRIVERRGRFSGIIEIFGKKFTAEFQNGVPANDRIGLKARRSEDGSYIFRLIEPSARNLFPESLRPYTIIPAPEIESRARDIAKFFNAGGTGIFELNSALLSASGTRGIGRHTAERLLKAGISRESIQWLSILLSDPDDINFFFTFIALLSNKRDGHSKRDDPSELFNKAADELSERILDADEDSEKLLQELIDISTNTLQGDNVFNTILYLDENEFREIKSIRSKEGVIFTLNLSGLGRLDIIIHKSSGNLNIAIVSYKSETKDFIDHTKHKLTNDLKSRGISAAINSSYSKNVLDKIVDLVENYQLYRVFDIKI